MTRSVEHTAAARTRPTFRQLLRIRLAFFDNSHAKWHIRTGFVASVLIMLASWGVGWLPNSQFSWFAGSVVLNPLRVDTTGVLACAVLLVVGGLLLTRSWIRLGQDLRLPHTRITSWRSTPRTRYESVPLHPRVQAVRGQALRSAAIWWTLPLLFSFPIFSRDVYSYMAQGRVVHSGLNPYQDGVSALPNWFIEGADSLWAESPSPYGPLFLMMARAVWFLSGGNPEIGVLMFRGLSVLGMILCWYTVPRLAHRFGSPADWALWISVLNPLFVLYLIAGVHNDSLMLGLLLAGLLCLHRYGSLPRGRWWGMTVLGIVLIAVSNAIKPLTVLALPFAGLMLVADADYVRPRYRHRLAAWVLVSLIAAAVLTLIGWASGLWFGWIPAMLTSGDAAFPYAPYGLLGLGIGWVVEQLVTGTDLRAVASVVYTLGTVLSLVVVAYLALKRHIIHPLRALGISLVVSVLLAPVIQPWYLLWVLPVFAVVRVWRPWISAVLYLLIIGLVIVGSVDQLSVPQWLSLSGIRLITAFIGIVGAIILIWIDRATRRSFPVISTDSSVQQEKAST